MTTKFPPFKAGDTFSYAGVCRLPAGLWSATCEIRKMGDANDLVGVLAVSLGSEANGDTPIALDASASETAFWAAGLYEVDVRYADAGGTVVHTSTLLLPVIKSVTQA